MRAVVLYPFSNLLEPGWGNSLRMSLLLKYLSQKCEEVWTFAPGQKQREWQDGNIRHISLASPLAQRTCISMRDRLWRIWGGLNFLAERKVLHLFTDHLRNPSFAPLVESTIRRCDSVFLQYPFWAATVIPLCKKYDVPCSLTAIDVHAETVGRDPGIKQRILGLELEAMNSADHAFCVSEEDRYFFDRHGVNARCVVNPIDFESCHAEADPGKIAQFRARFELGVGPICMFVGSRIIPNVEAVRAIDSIAPSVPGCQFVVAGHCATPGRKGNVVRLGLLPAEDLRSLYTTSEVVLMPLESGTGTSLKFVEALAYGKAIIGSTVAARGYGVVSGSHALIEDDFARYPERIRNLLADHHQRAELGAAAREISRNYDYRRVFQSYGELLAEYQSRRTEIRKP